MHAVHRLSLCNVHPCPPKPDLDNSQIGERHDAGQDMATDLAVRPVPKRHHGDQVIILGLTERLLHHIPVQTGPKISSAVQSLL